MITLYGHPVSGHTHRVSALLSLLKLDYEDKVMNLGKGEHKSEEFLALNPFGKIPVLTDGDVVLRDSPAIMVYLAKKYDKENRWLPEGPETEAQIQQWLGTAVNELSAGPAMVRAISVFSMDVDNAAAIGTSKTLFENVFEPHLAKNQWLVGDTPTIADVACYGYLARVNEGEFSLDAYPAIKRWIANVEAIENFPAMGHAADILKSA